MKKPWQADSDSSLESPEYAGGFVLSVDDELVADARIETPVRAHKAIQCVGWTETPNEIRWCVQTLLRHD